MSSESENESSFRNHRTIFLETMTDFIMNILNFMPASTHIQVAIK